MMRLPETRQRQSVWTQRENWRVCVNDGPSLSSVMSHLRDHYFWSDENLNEFIGNKVERKNKIVSKLDQKWTLYFKESLVKVVSDLLKLLQNTIWTLLV